MLSAGNLNTAALTLFLLLHLSVNPELPWLIIDDPVQSMDEVHIAQFAALLRTLSKGHRCNELVQSHFVGDKAWFTDESERNKNAYRRELTFKDPLGGEIYLRPGMAK